MYFLDVCGLLVMTIDVKLQLEHSVYLMHSLLLSIQSFLRESSLVQYATLPEQFSNNTSLIQDLFSRYLWSVIYDHIYIIRIGAFGVFDAFSTFIHPKLFAREQLSTICNFARTI